jgi:hypothetical protein
MAFVPSGLASFRKVPEISAGLQKGLPKILDARKLAPC